MEVGDGICSAKITQDLHLAPTVLLGVGGPYLDWNPDGWCNKSSPSQANRYPTIFGLFGFSYQYFRTFRMEFFADNIVCMFVL
jgi:hypothetical protein